MKVQFKDISQQPTWEDLQRFVQQNFDTLSTALTNQLSFPDNIDCQLVSVTFSSTSNDTTVPHTLKRVPSGYIPYNKSVASDVYNGATSWTKTNIYLKSTVAATIRLIVF